MVPFNIHDVRVNGLKDFGASVQLEGVTGRVEGGRRLTLAL